MEQFEVGECVEVVDTTNTFDWEQKPASYFNFMHEDDLSVGDIVYVSEVDHDIPWVRVEPSAIGCVHHPNHFKRLEN